MAVVSGFGMTVAASQWWSTSITRVLWVLPLWAVLYCLIERLVLKSFGTSWAWNVVLTIPRLVLPLAIALVIGLPMAHVIYSGSINAELSKTTTARIHEATNEITRTYDAKIAAAQQEIAAAQAKETRLQRQVTNSHFLADCEAGLASCSQTHKLGRGPYYKRDARRAAAATAELKRARPQIAATIAANRHKIAVWRAAESSQIANRVATIKANRDFLARQAALDRVEKASPAVTKYVEFFLAFLIAIDLVALMLKLTHLFSTAAPTSEPRPRSERTTSSRCTASRHTPPSSPTASRWRRRPSRMPTRSGFGASSHASPSWRATTSGSTSARAGARLSAAQRPPRRSATDDRRRSRETPGELEEAPQC
jgi:hypothetical protein